MMPNALQPDVSSYSDPVGNALLAKGWDGNAAIQQVQGVQQIQQNQVSLSKQQLDLGLQHLGAQYQHLGALVNNPTLNNFQNTLHLMVQNGVISPDAATQEATKVAGFNVADPDAPNPQIKQYAFDNLSQVADHAQLIKEAYGSQGTVNTGGATQPIVQRDGPQGGTFIEGGAPIPNTATPEFNASKQTWKTSDGVEHQGTQQQYQDAVGAGATGGGGAPPATGAAGNSTFANIAAGRTPASGGGTPAPTPSPAPAGQGAGTPPAPTAQPPAAAPTGQGAAPATWTPTIQTMPAIQADQANAALARTQAGTGTAADRNLMRAYLIQTNHPLSAKGATFEPQPGQPPQAPSPGGSPVPAGGGQAAPAPTNPQNAGLAGPAPGLAQAQGVDADASAKQFAGITASATNLPNMKATVSNMESVLPQITTGPQAAAWNKVKSYANFASELAAGKDVFDPKTIAAQDEFHNNSVKLAQQQFQQLGGTGTDGQLASASGDVPNESLSNMSNAQLLAMNKGLVDAQQARASAAEAWKQQHGPASYSGFVDQWNKSFSPRAFQFNYLSPADRGTMLSSMSPQEKAQLKTSYNTAVQNGWIAPQGAQK